MKLTAGVIVLVSCLSAAACGSDDETVRLAPDVACDQVVSSDDAKDIVEQVGGLVTDDYTVKFARGTPLGVVALVDGDTARAFQELRDDYGVVAVARLEEDRDPGTVSGFAQVDQIVQEVCGG